MNNNLCNKLFDFDINKTKKISVNKNEIYNQLLLYIFFSCKDDLLLVVPTLNEATEMYNELKKYLDNIFIFPEDDLITKRAVASSPELLFLRLKLLNNISVKEKKIVIVHLNSFISKYPTKKEYENNKIKIKVNDCLKRDELVGKLVRNGYKRESIVTETGEFSVRGYIIDVYAIHEDHPFRIEFFDEEIESIRYFDENTQKSTSEINDIAINSIKEDFDVNKSSILEYLNEPKIVYQNYNQILQAEKMLQPQVEYLNMEIELFQLSSLVTKDDIYINTIDNYGKSDIKINSQKIMISNKSKESFLGQIKDTKGILVTKNKKFLDLAKENEIPTIESALNSSFEYNNQYYYSDNDLSGNGNNNKESLSNYRFAKKMDSLDKIVVGDYVVHRKSGIGVYKGIYTIEKNGLKRDYILIEYKGNDKLYVPAEDIDKLYKYVSKEGVKPTIHKLNSLEWTKTKLKIKSRIKSITAELLEIYKKRNKSTIVPFSKDDATQMAFESEFQYEVTDDQFKASEEIKKDLEKSSPMERLLCGDVGYGKTEVIFRAMFKTVLNEKQVAYLCPTTILCQQQYDSAKDRFKNYAINIDLINRHQTNKEVQKKLKLLKNGKIDILFGTHRLLSSDVEFKELGLLVIDEEHKFGVEQKEKIKSIKSNVHVLSVSATPIPRSLQMSLVGIRDLSLIEKAPKNRYPVQTYVIEYNEMLIREVSLKEISRNGQVFILYNNVVNMERITQKYKKLMPEARICFAHGKMTKNEMQDVIYSFTNQEYDILISTTIIENGIDIPNANTVIVIDADRFGLSQLYQIRGRVGRSDKIAHAYLMYKNSALLSTIAKKRLEAIKEFTELGSGYKISMRDLSIRGAGDILGSEQAGFIDSVGVSMYLDLIKEESSGIDLDEDESNEDTLGVSVSTHIGSEYSDEDQVIIDIHKKINGITNRKELQNVLLDIEDRFGRIDENLKTYAYEKYFEKLLLITGLKINQNNNIKIVLTMDKELYTNISVQDLFVGASKISSKYNFELKGNKIFITLLKSLIEKEYLLYLVELLELVVSLKK